MSTKSDGVKQQRTCPSEAYNLMVAEGKLHDDNFQMRIIDMLDQLHNELRTYKQPPVPNPEDGLTARTPASALSRAFMSLLPLPDQVSGGNDQSRQNTPTGVFGALADMWQSRSESDVPAARPKDAPKGLYLFGDVGTGKSMLMDLFFDTLPPNVTHRRRLHFHQFMIHVHKRSHFWKSKYHRSSGIVEQSSGKGPAAAASTSSNAGPEVDEIDPIEPVAREIAQEMTVLCFDEFQVVDIADAMILRRLLERLLQLGTVIVMTSNRPPRDLYKNGIQRASFIPCIELIESEFIVTDLNSGTDYRKLPRARHQAYFAMGDAAYDQLWEQLTADEPVAEERVLSVWGHKLVVPRSTSRVARFTFFELCGKPRSAADYLALCKEFDTIFIDDIPLMNLDMRDLARRFITFIDAVYESKTMLYCSSEVDIMKVFSGTSTMDRTASDQMRALMDDLKMNMEDIGGTSIFSGDEELFAFGRLLSRLSEMSTVLYAETAQRRRAK